MSHQRPTQPKEVRRRMHADYDRYISGVDRFPRTRITEDFTPPRKTQPIASLLLHELAIIKEDRESFEQSALDTVAYLRDPGLDITPGTHNLVITRVGRNAVAYANLVAGEVVDGQRAIEATVGEFDRAEFVKTFDGVDINITDGRTLRFEDGQLVGDSPDLAVVRASNVSGMYLAARPRTVEETAAL